MGICPHQVVDPWPFGGERVLDPLRHLLWFDASLLGLARELHGSLHAPLVTTTRFRGNPSHDLVEVLVTLVPQRCLDRPRLDDRHLHARGQELEPEGFGDRLDGVLGRDVGPEERKRWRPPADGSHENDAALATVDRRHKRLGDCELADNVHFELTAKLVDRYELERTLDRYPRVVDQARKRPVAESLADRAGRSIYRSLVGNIQHHGHQPVGGVTLEALRIFLLANPGHDLPTATIEVERTRPSDPRGSACDHYGSGSHRPIILHRARRPDQGGAYGHAHLLHSLLQEARPVDTADSNRTPKGLRSDRTCSMLVGTDTREAPCSHDHGGDHTRTQVLLARSRHPIPWCERVRGPPERGLQLGVVPHQNV